MKNRLFLALLCMAAPFWAHAQSDRVTQLQSARNLVVTMADGQTDYRLTTSGKSLMIHRKDGQLLLRGDTLVPGKIKSMRLKSLTKYALNEDSTAFSAYTIDHGLLALRYSFQRGKWNALTLPVSLTGQQVLDAFGEDAQLVCYKGITENDAVVVDFESIDLDTPQTVLETGKFYLIRPTREPDIAVGQMTSVNYGTSRLSGPAYLVPSVSLATGGQQVPSNQSLRSESDKSRMRVVGSYRKQSVASPTRAMFFLNEDGLFGQATDTVEMKAFRNWMIEVRNETGLAWRFYVDGIQEDLTATGIVSPTADKPKEEGVYYDLMGRRTVGTPRPGIYIINGKKVFVR